MLRHLTLLLISAMLLSATPTTDAVLAAEARRAEALRQNDAVALAAVLSDDLRYIHSTGRLETKQQTVGDLAQKRTAYERFLSSDLHASQVAPGVVVLTGRIDQRKLVRGSWNDAILLFHSVWRDEMGTWRLVSLQTLSPAVPKP